MIPDKKGPAKGEKMNVAAQIPIFLARSVERGLVSVSQRLKRTNTVEEEHVVDHAEAYDLWSRDKQALKTAGNDEGYPSWRGCGKDGHAEPKKH